MGESVPAVQVRPEKINEYINRELSWMRFNKRVLDVATDKSKPLLERAKFLAIFARNLDEFFMIRVSGLIRQLREGVVTPPADGMTPRNLHQPRPASAGGVIRASMKHGATPQTARRRH